MESWLTESAGRRHSCTATFVYRDIPPPWHSSGTLMNDSYQREQFARCWLEVEPAVSAYVFASVSGFHDAEDVIQKIATELARRFDEYDSARPFVGWAMWIAKSRVIDFYRTQGRSRLVFSEGLLSRLAETMAEQANERSERREALQTCLEQLPDKSRHLLDLRYVEERSAAETAQQVNSTDGSVRVALTRIRSQLAECIRRRLTAEPAS
ncbi:MAG: sigma-70 family RNA polymerase sigma factor [Planctomycetaceae bacterium]|nr:sigma-70 family RNA polymerase sigma factor [Planctomycetaceae bacterium]